MVDGAGTTFQGGDFAYCVELVLGWEGPPTNDPDDTGGETVFGLARAFHPGIPWPPTRDQAIQIYRHEYWARVCGDDLPAPLALVVFDSAVNPGLSWVSTELQLMLRVDPDGVIGHETVAAARRTGPTTVRDLTARRWDRFDAIVRANPSKGKYQKGWRDRALKAFWAAARLEA